MTSLPLYTLNETMLNTLFYEQTEIFQMSKTNCGSFCSHMVIAPTKNDG